MRDFSSSLYLGLNHESDEINGWCSLTNGKPFAIFEPISSVEIGDKLGTLQGLESGIIGASTLHLFIDLFSYLSTNHIIYYDSYCYPIIKWGMRVGRMRRLKCVPYKHLCADHLNNVIQRTHTTGKIPVIVTDGWCPICGKPAAIESICDIGERYYGYVVIDDTQSFGVLGERIKEEKNYGKGGGGILKWLNIKISPRIVTICSLAKGFGVNAAVISASDEFLEKFIKKSKTRIHCSPPNNCTINSIENALITNEEYGDDLRERLFANVNQFKKNMQKLGKRTTGDIFPVQTIIYKHKQSFVRNFNELRNFGISAVPVRTHSLGRYGISFLITSNHRFSNIN